MGTPWLKTYTSNSLFCKITILPLVKRRLSHVSFTCHIGLNVADHAETLSRRRNWYFSEADLSETFLQRLIGT